MLLALSLLLAASCQQLEVHFLDVGQGDATLIVSPSGKTFLFDAGDNGQGNAAIVPYLQARGITHLDHVGSSHYHADHLGGLDEVWNAGIHATVCWDRGNVNEPTTQSYQDYKSRYAGVRQTVQPGQIVDLGGGVTMRCLSVEGRLAGGGSVNISGSSQWENSASIAWKLEYGDFDLFLGGDLTGGGNGTTDVESSVGALCGDVDVYQLNHHGSLTSSNANFVAALQPEFCVVPCGSGNIYGYPKQPVTDRLNKPSRAIPVWCTTDGVGTEGFVDGGGHLRLTTDGATYTVSALDGTTLRFLCDERALAAPQAGELVGSEFHRDPAAVNDADGEWFEIGGTRASGDASLDGLSALDAGTDSFTIATGLLIGADQYLVCAADGLPARNGGIRPALAWPSGSFALSNSGDRVALKSGATTIDQVDWSNGWPGGSGVASERRDLYASSAQSNHAAAVSSFGAGDKGTPGKRNDADVTPWSGGGGPLVINVITQPTVGGPMVMDWLAPGEAGYSYRGGVCFGTFPGHVFGGLQIPANLDAAWNLTSARPGWSGTVPPGEAMRVSVNVPNNAAHHGRIVFAAFYTYSPGPLGRKVSPVALMIVL
ncbi:MAG: MBL fold metallo-hydrolase [Planctomycetota bacterium]|nr:MBL fold metallo-hydrolase [Planctomycetota bacterium]